MTPRLLHKNGQPVGPNDELRTFRGDRAWFRGVEQPPSPGKSGKIKLSIEGRGLRVVYPQVAGLHFEGWPE